MSINVIAAFANSSNVYVRSVVGTGVTGGWIGAVGAVCTGACPVVIGIDGAVGAGCETGTLCVCTGTSLLSALTGAFSVPRSSSAKEVMKNLTPSPAFIPDEDYITLDKKVIKEYELPETIAIPIGHNRIKMKLDTLLAIIAIIISLFSSRPSASEQEQLALQRTEVQILSEILENTKASNATTSEQLDTLKESVDKIQKELAESKNNESGNQ